MSSDLIKELFRSTLSVQVAAVLVTVLGAVVNGIVTGGFLGVQAMASYGICSPMTYLYGGLAGVFSMGTSIPCSRLLGIGDKDKMNQVFSQSICFSLLCGLGILLLLFFGAEIIAGLLGANSELLPESAQYLRGYAFAAPAMFFMTALLPIMQLDADRPRALVAVVVLSATNIALSLFNGIVLHGGLFFMGIAYSVSYYAGAIVLLLHFTGNRGAFRLALRRMQLSQIRDLFVYGLPNALQQICRGILVISMNAIIITVSGDHRALAAYAAINVASMLCLAVGTGLGQSTSLITGILAGERDVESLRHLLKTALHTTIAMSAVLSAVVIIGAPVFMVPFVAKDPTCLDVAVEGFRLFGLCLVFYGINVVLRAYYQAMRLLRIAVPYVLLDNFASIALFAWGLSFIFGVTGIWLSFVAGEMFSLLVFVVVGLLGKGEGGLLDKLMHIGPNFTAGIRATKSWTCTNKTQVADVAAAIRSFCNQHGAHKRTAYFLALAAEEMCLNVVQYGFADGKRHFIDVKVAHMEGGFMLRIRDDCKLFDPLKYLKLHEAEDPKEHIGIRMTSAVADRMEYVSSLKLNNLIIEIRN